MGTQTFPDTTEPTDPLFRLLLLYRWLSLLPPFIFLFLGGNWFWGVPTLGTAVLTTIIITRFAAPLNRAWQKRPWLITIDLLLIASFITLNHGWRSPYYLYALSPLIAAALFFQLRGAILAATLFAPLYLAAIFAAFRLSGELPNLFTIITNSLGLYLISGAFGYAAVLLHRLRHTRDQLAHTHRELTVLHALTAALHRADDLEAIQDKVLLAITTELGCPQAIIGLADEQTAVITGWLGRGQQAARHPYSAQLPITALKHLRSANPPSKLNEAPPPLQTWLTTHFDLANGLLIPLLWGRQLLGLLLVDVAGRDHETTRRSLAAIADQTAVSLGMMTSRLRRAKESAIQQERARIALDIHDTVSQSLFGLTYTLNGSLKLLDTEPAAARSELQWAAQTAETVRQEIRHTIHDFWPTTMTNQEFEQSLRHHVTDVLQAPHLLITIEIQGNFATLPPPIQRTLYRISQESVTNVVHHAAASQTAVCLTSENGRVQLAIQDNGRGFEPAIALAQTHDPAHFGLRGIIERTQTLGGTCDIDSRPEQGTTITITLPEKTI